ncbi:hypothetical protein LWI29_032644 [Acer saccharum]|uniref:Polyprotein n=1 Tax=Acer saccharum TaxID=4024 RepID=A0AA39RFT2_ACESA|nr:hypothetical protein LWI29_032644 [Acer saccharum]
MPLSHPSPLWKNLDFFIKLPFKLNEDNNPTKTTHLGMSPSDLQLANEECNKLLRQGLIERTSSPWACQAFYVEKRSELLRGKKRLVVDYKPLNLFLRDDKFPVPRPNVLFSQLPGATIFSKFDLKGAFWQIDDTSHNILLQQFHDIVHHYGIMLSEKKSIVGRSEIEFLRINISNEQYRPGPHLVVRLLDFPDSDLNVKQVQQFLGIVNYVRDFIHHVSQYTSVLSTLLKKRPPPWNSTHTEAIIKLKEIS